MKFFWPDISDSEDAHKACSSAAGVAFFIAIVTGVIVLLQASGKINAFPGLGMAAYIDVALFILVGIGLIFHSRMASLAGLALYAAERFFMIKAYGFQAGHVVALVIFGLAFINGVRGAFGWHELKRIEKGENPLEIKAEDVVSAQPQKHFLGKVIAIFIFLGVIGAGAFWFLKNQETFNFSDQLKQKIQTFAKQVKRKKIIKRIAPPTGPVIRLKLKSGREFEGVLVKKNAEGYWLYIESMDEVYFGSNEVSEANEQTKVAN